MERTGSATIYAEIAEPVEVRTELRVGDIMMSSALSDPVFRRELAQKEILPNDFAADDGTGLFPDRVVGKIQGVGGKGAAIRILGIALGNLDNFDSLNGDKEAVRDQMSFMLENLRREYKLSKKPAYSVRA